MRRAFFLLFLIPSVVFGQSGWSGGAYADSARAASIADSAKAVRVAGTTIYADQIRPNTAGHDTIGFWANPVIRPWGKLFYDTDPANDNARISAPSGLDPGYSDFAIFFYGYPHIFQSSFARIVAKDGNPGWYLARSSGAFVFFLKGITNSFHSDVMYAQGDTSEMHSWFIYVDRDGYVYWYRDGELLEGQDDISSFADTLVENSNDFIIGPQCWLTAGVIRIFNFGTNPTVYHATLARRLAERPLARLSELGFGEWEDADWTNLLAFYDGQATSDFESGIGLWIAWSGASSVSQSSAQAHGGSYSLAVTTNGSSAYLAHVNDGADEPMFESDKWTIVECYIYLPNGWDGGDVRIDALNLADVKAKLYKEARGSVTGRWQYCSTLIKAGTDFRSNVHIVSSRIPSAGLTFHIDNVSVHRVGEVAFWKFNDPASSTVFTDETSNNNDLTPYSNGVPTTAGNLQVEADLNHFFVHKIGADTIVVDSTFSWNVRSRRLYLSNDTAPGSGVTVPLIYADGGHVWVHDGSTGVNTQISPHNGHEWVFNSWDPSTGVRYYANMFDVLQVLEELSGKRLLYVDTVAVEVPAEVAADTVEVVVVDTLKNTRTKIRYLRPKQGYIQVGDKFKKIDFGRVAQPPAQYLNDRKNKEKGKP